MRTLYNILLYYFAASTAYVLLLSIAGLFRKKRNVKLATGFHKIVILVPAYKEDAVIYSTAQALTKLDYPSNLYDIVIIADSLQEDTLKKLSQLPIEVVEVGFQKSTKAKALNKATATLEDSYDIAIISDADNILKNDFLQIINQEFSNGATVIQGKRVAKNLDTPVAVLDAYSEVVNNHIFRKGANSLGLSSALIGSGMAFQYADLKEIMANIDAVGGFDRLLQLALVDRGHYIKYIEEAIVFDEKVSEGPSFENQRRRWYASQFKYLRKYFFKGITMLFRGNTSYFNLSVLGSIFLSRVINLGALSTISLMTFFLGTSVRTVTTWCLLFTTYALSILLPLSMLTYKSQLFRATFMLPKILLLTLKTSLKIKGADQKFIHTSHRLLEINSCHYEKK